MIVRKIVVQGLVQGVGFRAATFRFARSLPGLRGYVRNLPDGSVEAVFAGEERSVFSAVAWCRQGPPASTVNSLAVIEEPESIAENFPPEFEIR